MRLPAAMMTDEAPPEAPVRREHAFRTTGPAVVPPGGILDLPLLVFGLRERVESVALSLHLRHHAVGTLTIALAAPHGEARTLLAAGGATTSSLGESCARPLVFEDSAASRIDEVFPPLVGAYRPAESLAGLAALPVEKMNGCWRLVISDVGRQRPGALLACVALVFRR
jgi:hypothetical protein